ncbi:TPA: hypothetical protein TY419_000740 [Streptococcus suis]|nr:hypothetical protein [Streptococcus suis]HEM2582130.1 hypothetical protein [Streptococcus suis]
MNKEDKFIKELLYVGLGEEALEETTYLKNIVTKSDIVKNLLNELKMFIDTVHIRKRTLVLQRGIVRIIFAKLTLSISILT